MSRQAPYRPKVGDKVRFRWHDEQSPARTYNMSVGVIMLRDNDGLYSVRVANGYSHERIRRMDIIEKLEGDSNG